MSKNQSYLLTYSFLFERLREEWYLQDGSRPKKKKLGRGGKDRLPGIILRKEPKHGSAEKISEP
jgi:hypothetical protein